MAQHSSTQQIVALHYLMAKGHGFANVSEVTSYMANPFKEIVFGFKSYCPELNQGSEFLNGSWVMKHEVVFWLQMSLRIEFQEERVMLFNDFG